jgi:L-ascorbate metabolism protein UlaG (beta-lactamase superfamily)
MVARTLAIVCLTLWTAVGQDPATPASQRAALPALEPGVLSSGEVYRGTFTPGGDTLYFFKKTGAGETYRIFSSNRTATGWSVPTVVDLGGTSSDLYPAISPDGRRMVFSSYRAAPGDTTAKPNAHLWSVERTATGWSAPTFLARASTFGHYHSWVEFGFDGALYFRRTTPDWKSTETLRASWTASGISTPEPYADVERWKRWRPDVVIAGGSPGPGGRFVFLDVATKNPRTGRGASDIWVAVKHGNDWSDPAPLGAGVNSDGYDVFPFLSPDGRDLYFIRDFATFHRIPLADALASLPTSSDVRYVANSGMLVSIAGRRFLIDAPIRAGISPYAVSAATERALLEGARAPYDRIDAILITHWHEDHFSAEAVAAHLRSSPATVLISSPEVVGRVRSGAPDLPASRLRAFLPDPGSSARIDEFGVPVHVLRIRHNPTRRLPEQHLGFLIGSDTPVLHVGDADPTIDNFTLLKSLPRVDVAFLPFWYVTGGANRPVVTNAIQPQRIVAMHVPPQDVEKVSSQIRAAGVTATVASTPGTPLRIAR